MNPHPTTRDVRKLLLLAFFSPLMMILIIIQLPTLIIYILDRVKLWKASNALDALENFLYAPVLYAFSLFTLNTAFFWAFAMFFTFFAHFFHFFAFFNIIPIYIKRAMQFYILSLCIIITIILSSISSAWDLSKFGAIPAGFILLIITVLLPRILLLRRAQTILRKLE